MILILIIFLEINECEEPGGCPKNANCTDLLGLCDYVCKDGFEGSSCSGKKLIMVLHINKFPNIVLGVLVSFFRFYDQLKLGKIFEIHCMKIFKKSLSYSGFAEFGGKDF